MLYRSIMAHASDHQKIGSMLKTNYI